MAEHDLRDPEKEPARIRAFFVDPAAARRGVGRSLFDECTRAAATAGFRSLELMATLPGVPFYAALGFEIVEQVTDRLPDDVPIRFVRMRRGLPGPDRCMAQVSVRAAGDRCTR